MKYIHSIFCFESAGNEFIEIPWPWFIDQPANKQQNPITHNFEKWGFLYSSYLLIPTYF